jgi:hypothetical protein
MSADCVLCGKPHHCGIAAGEPDCWCFTSRLPPGVLERLSPAQRNAACVCQACIASHAQEPQDDETGADHPAQADK